jgi:hypothetical protein
MAYKRRKEIVEKQLKEHNQLKNQNKRINTTNSSNQVEPETVTAEKSAPKCPFAVAINSESINTENKASNQNKKEDKKIVVSIQSNEEKQKESVLSINAIL